jgi:DNA polymerase-3 subunit delta
MSQAPALAYFWGEDAFGIDRAARAYTARLSPPEEPMETWRLDLDDDQADEGAAASASGSAGRRRSRALDALEEHLAMAPLFGSGTLVLLRQPGVLLAESAARERLLGIVRSVPSGNALCVTDLVASGAKGPAARGALRDAVADAGGLVAELTVPAARRLEAWLVERAAELGTTLEPAAARLLAERVGGHVREGDVDRRRRTELANAELEKLALYRPGGVVAPADVDALVSESIPGSAWAFLDAVGERSVAAAATLAERLLHDAAPLPVLITQLHRRLRDLLIVAEHLAGGSRPTDIVKALGVQPFRAQKLAEQARRWTMGELHDAFADLLTLDLRSKGISLDGSTLRMSPATDALELQAWLARHASPARRAADRTTAPRH